MSERFLYVVVGGLLAAIPAYFAYRRASRTDKVTERIGMATGQAQSTAQAFDALNNVISGQRDWIAQMQAEKVADDANAREDFQRLQVRFDATVALLSVCQRDARTVEQELDRMYRKYGNGDAPG